MERVLILGISLIILLPRMATPAVNASPNNSLKSCDFCSYSHCEPHTSFTSEPVQVFKSSNKINSVFCLSPVNVTWYFQWESGTKISVTRPEGYAVKDAKPFKTKGQQLFCSSLTVVHPLRQNGTVKAVNASCKVGVEYPLSKWYNLDEILKPPVPSLHSDPSPGQENSSHSVNGSSPNLLNSYDGLQPGDGQNHGGTPTSNTTTHAVIGGAAVCVAVLLTLVIVLMMKVKRQRETIEMTHEEINEFMLGIAEEKAKAKGINGLFILPYDTKLEIPKSSVTIRSTVLGSGAFGQVVKGEYKGNQVAIKMLKNNANSSGGEYLRSLLGELKVMSYLGSHSNLVGLIGAITSNIKRGEVYLVFEYCPNGNAHKFVRSHRESFVDMLASAVPCTAIESRSTTNLTTRDLVRWAYEIASGMESVSAQNVYHGDLAARNILLTADLTAKVGDFGLSKQLDMEKYNCYMQKKECPLPLKWMAIESLRDLTFSIQSDVWSYGVTLWELFTLGASPYPGVDWSFESWKLLREGKRLDRPEYASESVYNVMLNCWDADPKARPGFAQLKDSFCKELEGLNALEDMVHLNQCVLQFV